jgi:hypothetical protein
MKVWRRFLPCMAAVLLALGLAGSALGATVSGRASTDLEWFDDAEGGYDGPLLPVFPAQREGHRWQGPQFILHIYQDAAPQTSRPASQEAGFFCSGGCMVKRFC